MIIALAVALVPASPAPKQHCGIETRVWCLRATDNHVSMVTEGDFRTWMISDLESETTITVKESANCDSVATDGPLKTQLVFDTSDSGRKRRPLVTFAVPEYRCTLVVSWDPPTADPQRTYEAVLSAVWVGTGEKRPLLNSPSP